MANFGTAYLTNLGRDLRDKATTQGFPLQVTRMALGSGQWPDGTETAMLTALIQEELSLAIQGVVDTSGGQHKVTAVLTNESLAVGFDWRELALFCQDPDLGEVLYMASYADKPDHIPPPGSQLVEMAISMIIRTAIGVQVTAVIDDTLVLATKRDVDVVIEDLAAHKARTDNPHSVTKAQVGLGNLPNAKSDSVTLASTTTLATSLAVKTVKDAQAATQAELDAHEARTDNPHGVTKAQVGLGNLPNAKSDSVTLASTTTLATSLAVKTVKDAQAATQAELDTHEARTNNPHGVTAAQAGAAPKSHASTATTYGAASESNYGHVQLANSNPAGLGTASKGTSSRAARADHVHPLPSTSQVLAALAGASVGAVGTYAFLHTAGQDEEPFVQGSIWSGSSLRYAASVVNANATNDGYYASETTVSPPGTWRAMGRFDGAASTNGLPGASLFLRIS